MGKIIKNGISYSSAGSSGGSDIQVLTQEEYDALVTAGTVDENIYYFIGDEDENGEAGDTIPAFYIGYDNSTSGLTATDIQEAVDEVNGKVNEVNNDITELSNNFSNALEDIVNDIETIERYSVPSVDDAYDVAPSVQYILRTYFSDITSGFINLKFYMEYYKASTSTGYSGAIVDCLVSGGRASGIIKIRSSVDTYSFYCDVTSGGADAVVKKLGSGVEASNITAVSLPYTAPSNGIIIVQVLSGRRALGEYANVITTSATITVDGTTVASKSGKNTSSEKNNWGSGDSGKAVYHQEECSYIGAVTKGQVINASATSSNTTGSYYYSYSDRNAWFIPV